MELLGGLAIFAGAFVELVSIPLIVMMLVAMLTVHLKHGFSAVNTIGLTADGPEVRPSGVVEINLLYIAGLVSLILSARGGVLRGPPALSQRREKRTAVWRRPSRMTSSVPTTRSGARSTLRHCTIRREPTTLDFSHAG